MFHHNKATSYDHQIIDTISTALNGKIGQDNDIKRLKQQITKGPNSRAFCIAASDDWLTTACQIAIAFIRWTQDLKETRKNLKARIKNNPIHEESYHKYLKNKEHLDTEEQEHLQTLNHQHSINKTEPLTEEELPNLQNLSQKELLDLLGKILPLLQKPLLDKNNDLHQYHQYLKDIKNWENKKPQPPTETQPIPQNIKDKIQENLQKYDF